jgi:sulfite exporter TauE/SafE
MSTLASGSPRRAWVLGVRWGLGHSLGSVLLGALALVLQRSWGIDAASGWSDRAAGVMMIALGLLALRRALSRRVHTHVHSHGGREHEHVHLHLDLRQTGHRHGHAPYAIGVLHGFGGGAHLFGVLPALAFPHLIDAALYFGGFVVATIAAMALVATSVGRLAQRGTPTTRRAFASACGLASCGVGGWWALGLG